MPNFTKAIEAWKPPSGVITTMGLRLYLAELGVEVSEPEAEAALERAGYQRWAHRWVAVAHEPDDDAPDEDLENLRTRLDQAVVALSEIAAGAQETLRTATAGSPASLIPFAPPAHAHVARLRQWAVQIRDFALRTLADLEEASS